MYLKNLIPSELKTLWRIVAICQSASECQVDDFLSGLQSNLAKHSKSMRQMLATAAIHGPTHFHKDVCHNISDGVYQFTKGDLRVSWFYDGNKMVICCQAAIKKGRKTPQPFIDASEACMREYKLQKSRSNITELPEEK